MSHTKGRNCYVLIILTILSWTVVQCKHAPLSSELQHAQVLGKDGAVYVFIYDKSTSPPSVVVKQCEERALAVNNDCPQQPRNKTKFESRISLSNLKFEMAKQSQKFAYDLKKLSLSPQQFAELFIKHYIADDGQDSDLDTLSAHKTKSPLDQLYTKVIEEFMKSGFQAVLDESYQVIRIGFADSGQSNIAISYCTSEIGKYCIPEKSLSSATTSTDDVKKVVPAAFYAELNAKLKDEALFTDGFFFNESIYTTDPWQEPTQEQLQFMQSLNEHLSKMTSLIFTQGFEFQIANEVSVFECNRIDRINPKCDQKSAQPRTVTFENFQTSLYDMTTKCLKNRFSCYPGPYVENTLKMLLKVYAGDKKKIVSIRDATDYAARELKSRSRDGKFLLIGKQRLIRFDKDTSENKLDYFVAEIFFHFFNPNYMPPIEIIQEPKKNAN